MNRSNSRSGGANLPALRHHNASLVLDLLRVAGEQGISRLELAERTGLTPQAVSKITARLRAEGLAAEAGRLASTGGKPRTVLRLVPDAGYAVGLHLDRDELTAVLADLAGTTVATRTFPLDLGAPAAEVLAAAAHAVRTVRGEGPEAPRAAARQVFGVGAALPGPLDHRSGVLHRVTGFPRWDGYPLRDALARETGLPVVVDKDTNAAALGLALRERAEADFAYLHLGTGLGAGLVLGGALHRGARTGAGEFGHQTVQLDGPLCDCGGRGCIEALCLAAAARGDVAALRQVTKVAEQCRGWAGRSGAPSYFSTLAEGAGEHAGPDLAAGVAAAEQAYADLADFLTGELAAAAPTEDAVGEERYRLWSRLYTGARIDLAEAYEWGWAEFTRIETEMQQVADRIKPGATVAEAAAHLDADPRYRVVGQDALREWMQRLSDQALSDLRGVHFDIPDRLMRLECRISPPGGPVGAYYNGPTEDWSRPGRMWWSVPADRTEFSTWREVTTVYHEGAPGHHLQIATAVNQAASLNKFQRLLAWVPGYGEGWALYAERLMREFGYLDDDGDLLGMLDAHLFRAARVVVDIGMHLKLEIPRGTGFHEGERWTPDLGLEFMLTRTITDPAHVHDEIDRYLGWPGQAPTYKLGERLWLRARDEAKARRGAEFDLKRFHQEVLEMGAMGLDTLTERLAAL